MAKSIGNRQHLCKHIKNLKMLGVHKEKNAKKKQPTGFSSSCFFFQRSFFQAVGTSLLGVEISWWISMPKTWREWLIRRDLDVPSNMVPASENLQSWLGKQRWTKNDKTGIKIYYQLLRLDDEWFFSEYNFSDIFLLQASLCKSLFCLARLGQSTLVDLTFCWMEGTHPTWVFP